MAKVPNPRYVPFQPFSFSREEFEAEVLPHLKALHDTLERLNLPYIIAIQTSAKEDGEGFEGNVNVSCRVDSKNAAPELYAAAHVLQPDASEGSVPFMIKLCVQQAGFNLQFVRTPEVEEEMVQHLPKPRHQEKLDG